MLENWLVKRDELRARLDALESRLWRRDPHSVLQLFWVQEEKSMR
jgi:hypothetical protein